MTKRYYVWIVPALLVMWMVVTPSGGLFAQTGEPKQDTSTNFKHQTKIYDSRIDMKGVDIEGGLVTIKYDIPYNGVVEFRLFDPEGEKLYQNYYVNNFGENKIILKRSNFNPGQPYAYILNYKQDEVKQELIIPETN